MIFVRAKKYLFVMIICFEWRINLMRSKVHKIYPSSKFLTMTKIEEAFGKKC